MPPTHIKSHHHTYIYPQNGAAVQQNTENTTLARLGLQLSIAGMAEKVGELRRSKSWSAALLPLVLKRGKPVVKDRLWKNQVGRKHPDTCLSQGAWSES